MPLFVVVADVELVALRKRVPPVTGPLPVVEPSTSERKPLPGASEVTSAALSCMKKGCVNVSGPEMTVSLAKQSGDGAAAGKKKPLRGPAPITTLCDAG
ncbi:MAG TPA: hypothetical protein VKG44_10630 [Candidatus Baltobacteraceae bacterium]|nr:hypothetical protein [Candidatus Baltobacteraceae bacterium]